MGLDDKQDDEQKRQSRQESSQFANRQFELASGFSTSDSQQQTVDALVSGLHDDHRFQTLRGVTGSGKTFIMAQVIQSAQVPTLVISPNKTLAAQLYSEFSAFFPNNAVGYFVSYYDYYQPEAYVAARDLYIEKDASINDEIDRLRLAATTNLLTRKDIIIVATVSCIYGLGNPVDYMDMLIDLRVGEVLDVHRLKRRLVDLQYERNNTTLERGQFRIHGEVIDIFPAYKEVIYRIILDWDKVVSIRKLHVVTQDCLEVLNNLQIFPAKHFVTTGEHLKAGVSRIRDELERTHQDLLDKGMVVEAQRIKSRTEYDLEVLSEVGYCSGIENYSRHMSGRGEGERPSVLLDYFPTKFLTFIDESHIALPQIRGMYNGDRARKLSLVTHGFRLPSALDNRPLYFEEFESMLHKCIFVSATPAEAEVKKSTKLIEQIIRPTGLLDPEIEVHPSAGQIEHLYGEIQRRIAIGDRVLITTLTKKMSEELCQYFETLGVKVRYLHSEIGTVERVEILRDLRQGVFDVLIGINLLREGLDMPEVSLVAILDADKIGFLRSARSLIQTIGRAARNVRGKVILYADKTTHAIEEALQETNRRRAIQAAYNQEHNITPKSIEKSVKDIIKRESALKEDAERNEVEILRQSYNIMIPAERNKLIKVLEKEMKLQVDMLAFEKAIVLRDEIERLKA